MNLPLVLEIAKIIGILLGTIAFALTAYWKMKEKALTRDKGLDANPERCEQHAIRLAVIEERLERIETDIAEIKGKKP
ncbi:MAG: hypothetical protein MUP81_02630 [Dehalococcoidia bacterium]|nr:hypothetical protein [Dehalococcoidia bacterium]